MTKFPGNCPKRLAAILITSGLAWVSLTCWSQASAQDLTIAKVVWARAVDSKSYSGEFKPKAPSNPPIVFWTLVTGEEKALEEVQKLGGFPLAHVWTHYPGSIPRRLGEKLVTAAGGRQGREIDVGDAQPTNLKRLEDELSAGPFTWGTWSEQEVYGHTLWKVKVINRGNGELTCLGEFRDPDEECAYWIEID